MAAESREDANSRTFGSLGPGIVVVFPFSRSSEVAAAPLKCHDFRALSFDAHGLRGSYCLCTGGKGVESSIDHVIIRNMP